MNIIFGVLPFLVSILVVFTKRKIVNSQSGRKYAYREMILDVVRVLVVTIISLSANVLCGKEVSIWTLLIDVFMLLVYILPLLQKNYDYVERKALMGIWASCIFMLVIAIAIFQMLIGSYDISDSTLAFCFVKGVSYFGISIWCCFTTGEIRKKDKFKALMNGLVSSYKDYKLSVRDYYCLAFLELFIFTGMNRYFNPVGIFGLHEIINKKKLKGFIYIILGNFCLFLQYKFQIWGDIACLVYTLFAFIDMLIHFINIRKGK